MEPAVTEKMWCKKQTPGTKIEIKVSIDKCKNKNKREKC